MGTKAQVSANHILEHNLIRSTLASKLFGDADMRHMVSLLQKDFVDSHQSATTILDRYLSDRDPFVLYLRSFEFEAYDWLSKAERGKDRIQATYVGGPSPLERAIADQIAPLAPAIAVANPANLSPWNMPLPRLALPSSDWKETIRALINSAEAVIVYLETLARGVAAELSLVRELSKKWGTIIVIPSPGSEDRSIGPSLARIFGADVADPVRTSRERLHLSGFPQVVSEDELDLEALAGAPAFSRVARQLEWASGLSAEQRGQRAEAALLSEEGLALLAQREFDRAEQALQAALRLRVEIDSKGGIVTSIFNLSVLYMDKGDYRMAAAGLRELIPKAHAIGQPSSAGVALTYLGEAYRSVGDLGRAVDNFREGLALLEQTGSAEDQLNAVAKLLVIFAEAGQTDQARACLERAKELQAAQAGDPIPPHAAAE